MQAHSAASAQPAASRDSYRKLVITFLTLVALTLTNVGLRQWDFGAWNICISLSIAALKACLVLGIFMHLLGDRSFNMVVVSVTVATMLLFILLAATDGIFSSSDIEQFSRAKPARVMPALNALSKPAAP